MNENSLTIESLQSRLQELETENAYLKSLLNQVGIPYTPVPCNSDDLTQSLFDPDQGSRIIPVEITYNHARRFFSFFWGRMDVYSKRSQNKTNGKAGYFPQCDNFWRRGICPKASGLKVKCKDCANRAWTKLNAYQIENHLRGNKQDSSDVIGIYPLFPDGTCRLLIFDFDNHNKGAEEQDFANEEESWIEEVNALRDICPIRQGSRGC